MANPKHLEKLSLGVKAFNEWTDAYDDWMDLSNADLRFIREFPLEPRLAFANANLRASTFEGVELHEISFLHSNLEGVSFRNSKLHHLKFLGARLDGADFRGAFLVNCNFYAAFGEQTMTDASFHGTQLLGCDITHYSLEGTTFENSSIGQCTFRNVDLSGAIGLDSVRHMGPSTLALDTIYRSKGRISDNFLRGCGVPDSFITQMRSLVGAEDGIQFHSCFISFSHADEEFARRLHGRMQQEHLRVWFSPEDMKAGRKLREEIESAIHVYDKLLVVLSEASMSSAWVKDEIRKARKAELKTGKRKLFPIRLMDLEVIREWDFFDSIANEHVAAELCEYHIPDFSNWKDHDSFEHAFKRLLRDLRADARGNE